MSVTLELRTVEPGSDDYVHAAWDLKETIREREGVLKQRKRFFYQAYRRARCNVLLSGEELIGFTSTRSDGYLLFLAVHPDHRGNGHGRRLIAAVADQHDVITCHARSTNTDAIEFYRTIGFELDRHISNYYEDRGDAFLLRLGESTRFRDRLREYLT